MDESYSSGGSAGGGDTTNMPAEKPAEEKPSVDEQNAGEQTAVVSNKILSPKGQSLKEGDEVVLVVVKNYGDESEVKYAPAKGGGGGEPSEPGSDDDMGVGSELAALSNEKA